MTERWMRFDRVTEKWMREHWGVETTVARCDECGLYYKPELGHKCKAAAKEKKE